MPNQTRARRRRFRTALPVNVRIECAAGARSSGELEEKTVTENISSGGCFFYLSHRPRLGAATVMEIAVPYSISVLQHPKIRCYGTVIRVEDESEPGKVGVACKIRSYDLDSLDVVSPIAY